MARDFGQSIARLGCLCCPHLEALGHLGAATVWRLIHSLSLAAGIPTHGLFVRPGLLQRGARFRKRESQKRELRWSGNISSDLDPMVMGHPFLHRLCHKVSQRLMSGGRWNRLHFLVREEQNSDWVNGTENIVLAMKLKLLYSQSCQDARTRNPHDGHCLLSGNMNFTFFIIRMFEVTRRLWMSCDGDSSKN